MRYSSRVSACRRELNSHEAAKPQTASDVRQQIRQGTLFKCGRKGMHSIGTTGQSKRGLVMNTGNHKSNDDQDMDLRCHIATPCRSGNSDFQSIHGAAAACIRASNLGCRQQLEYVARQGPQRGAGRTRSWPRGVTIPCQAEHARALGTALPNHSLEARPNIKTPGPRSGAGYYPPRGPGVLLLVPPQLER